MCGIVGIVGGNDIAKRIVSGLERLEYRGYDSAGIALINDNKINILRSVGKISNLKAKLSKNVIEGTVGIGHTRWATHGGPSENNAHPHSTDKVTLVHNGIIENHLELKSFLEGHGHKFVTETDTEVIPHLITYYLNQGKNPFEAFTLALKKLEGAYAIAAIFAGHPGLMLGARKGSPLAVGYGDEEAYLGSDSYALSMYTGKISYLKEGDVVKLEHNHIEIFDESLHKVTREIKEIDTSELDITKGNYHHFMQKEIFEQPSIIASNLGVYFTGTEFSDGFKAKLPKDLDKLEKIYIVACGTSYYAAYVAKYWFETYAKIATEIDIASEFRYRDVVFAKNALCIFISQSGETADTLAALKYAKENGQRTLAIINSEESSMAREAGSFLNINAGREIGVASTKAFTAQLTTLAAFILYMGASRKHIDQAKQKELIQALSEVPGRISVILNQADNIQDLAKEIVNHSSVLFIGRGTAYAVALGGALKLKELSYIHAEALAAGELKHGTIALIDENTLVIAIATPDHLFPKTASNIQEIAARKGKILTFSDKAGCKELDNLSFKTFEVPKTDSFVCPLLYVIPLQLLAYYVAHLKGNDIDQPRNLAKSVTVE